MPPPKPSNEGPRDRRVLHEMRKIVRALQTLGPTDRDRLAEAVGAAYWEGDDFDEALSYAVADGHVVKDASGRLSAV
jgi:hypothetical protein